MRQRIQNQKVSRRGVVAGLGSTAALGLVLPSDAQSLETNGAVISRLNTIDLPENLRLIAKLWRSSRDPYKKLVAEFYILNGYPYIWHNGRNWTSSAYGVFKALKEIAFIGLEPENYGVLAISSLHEMIDSRSIAQIEALMTVGVLRYFQEAEFGRYHSVDPVISQRLLMHVLGKPADQAYNAMVKFNPQNRLFKAMRQSLENDPLTPEQRRQIVVNMHRQRVDEYEPFAGKQVLVDLGLQQLTAYDHDKLELAMGVVVGKPERRTPMLRDKIVSLKFSPDWTVPQTIAREDLVPIMAHDPSIVDGFGLEVKNHDGSPVSMETIEWSKYIGRNFPYIFYQKPGVNNLLGGVRFSLTNDMAIYLHDSPDVDSFDIGTRAFSSGCVRLSQAADLAEWIMQDEQGWSEEQVVGAMVSGVTRTAVLKNPVRVIFYYSTATLNGSNQLILMPDIYGEDATLAQTINA